MCGVLLMILIPSRNVAIISPYPSTMYRDLLIEAGSIIGIIEQCIARDPFDFFSGDTVYFLLKGEVLMIKDDGIEKFIVPIANIKFKIED